MWNNSLQWWDRLGIPKWLSGKESTCNAGNVRSIPCSERSPGEVNNNSLQYSWLGNPTNRGVWWAIVHGVTKEPDRAYLTTKIMT